VNMHRSVGRSALLFFGGSFQQVVPPRREVRARQFSLVYQEGPW
jgi:hypothetical protein